MIGLPREIKKQLFFFIVLNLSSMVVDKADQFRGPGERCFKSPVRPVRACEASTFPFVLRSGWQVNRSGAQ